MKELRSRLTIISLICLMAVSAASCDSAKPDPDDKTVVVTTAADDAQSEPDDQNSDSKETDAAAPATEAPVPEVDADGSKVSVIEVTDAQNAAVTDNKGAAVTEIVILDNNGTVVTDAAGNNAKPVFKETTAATTKAADRIVATDPPSQTPSGNTTTSMKGPTLSIAKDIKAKAGEEFTFTIDITDNTAFHGLIAWLDINEKYFELVSYDAGDPNAADYEDSVMYNNVEFTEYTKKNAKDLKTLIVLYFDATTEQYTENGTYATITLKVKENTPAGKYDLAFDAVQDAERAQGNTIVKQNGKKVPVPLDITFVNGSVTVE